VLQQLGPMLMTEDDHRKHPTCCVASFFQHSTAAPSLRHILFSLIQSSSTKTPSPPSPTWQAKFPGSPHHKLPRSRRFVRGVRCTGTQSRNVARALAFVLTAHRPDNTHIKWRSSDPRSFCCPRHTHLPTTSQGRINFEPYTDVF